MSIEAIVAWFLWFCVFVLFLLLVMTLAGLFIPIDEGGEVSRLATAGIMRNADV